MKTQDKNNSEIMRLIEKNDKLTAVRQEILSSVNKKLYHKIDFKIHKRVNELHTASITSDIWADYFDGSITKGFDSQSGKCFHSQTFLSNTTEVFTGFNCRAFNLTIARNSESGKLFAFDTTRHKSLQVPLLDSTGKITDLVLTPDKFIIFTSLDGAAYIYRSADWKFIRKLSPEKNSPLTCLALIPFSQNILLGSSDGAVQMFDYRAGKLINKIKLSKSRIKSISTTTSLFCVLDEHTLFVYDFDFKIKWTKPALANVVKMPLGDIWSHSSSLLYNNHRADPFMTKFIFLGMKSGAIEVINIDDNYSVNSFEQHKDQVSCMMTSPDKVLFTGSYDGSIRRLDFPSFHCQQIYHQTDGTRSIAVSVDNSKYICVSGISGDSAKLIDFNSGKILNLFEHQNSVRCVRFHEEYLFTAGWDSRVIKWNCDDGSLLHEYLAPANSCVCQITIQKNILGVAYYFREHSGGFQIFDLTSNKEIMNVRAAHKYGDLAQSVFLQLTTDGKVVFSAADDGVIHKWQLNGRKPVKSLYHGAPIKCIALTSDNRTLLSADIYGSIKWWDTNSGQLKRTISGYDGAIYFILLSADNRYFFTGNENGRINKFQFNGDFFESFHYQNSRVWELAFTNEGKTLISASEDGTLVFISLETSELLGKFYNTQHGFLWATPENEKNNEQGYYWTDNLANIKVYETNLDTQDERLVVNAEADEYHAIHNNSRICMSRINGSAFYKIYEAAKKNQQQQNFIKQLSRKDFNLLSS